MSTNFTIRAALDLIYKIKPDYFILDLCYISTLGTYAAKIKLARGGSLS
ncbi:MAG: hypothetical protein Q8K59_02500 [Nitrosomonas sp.]|nr:hypothetical protein [Nitrosomonas sp.]MDP1949962.1 hypothetical protein [Nitrosomonas sp.]